MYAVSYERPASKRLDKLAQKDPSLTAKIIEKIDWLAKNADQIDHEKMKGHTEMSLHFRDYRILYQLNRFKQTVTICLIEKHDKAYQKLRRRK